LFFRFIVRIDRLRRLAKGDNKDYAPTPLILFLSSFKVRVDRLRRLAKGYNRDYAPSSPIELFFR